MASLSDSYYTLRTDLATLADLPLFPAHLLELPDDGLLSRLYRTKTELTDAGLLVELSWDAGDPILIGLQEASGASLALGYDGVTALTLTIVLTEDDQVFTLGGGFSLSFDSDLIRPVEWVAGAYQILESEPYRVGFAVDLSVGSSGLTIGGPEAIVFPPFAIGETGIVVDPGEVRLVFSPEAAAALIADHPAAGLDAAFRGVFIAAGTLYFPAGFPVASIGITNASIGANGFSGSVSAIAGDPTLVAGPDLSGLPFALREIELTFVQNALTACRIVGALTLPFFDEPLDVSLGLGIDGAVSLSLADSATGLAELNLPQLGTLTLAGLGLVNDGDGSAVLLDGSLLLSVLSPGLQWPTIDLQALRISSDGEVDLPNGWLDLQTPVALDLFGFVLEISRIGFGSTDDGRRWFGLSAGVHLVDFLPTGVSVEGLRITWDPLGLRAPEVSLQGVGLELTLPGVLTLAGDVAFVNEETERYFKGNIKLALLPLGLSIDASLKVGRDLVGDYKYVYTFMDLTLPVGLPLWATGAALYGFSGLYGINVNPSVQNSDWYGWYAGAPAPLNVTHTDKWIGFADGKAIGAGLTLGTMFDLGRVVTVKGLLVLVLPGPVIMLHGKANFLQLPPDNGDPSSEGVLNALAVLDGQSGSLQLAVDAGWSQGQVLEIAASAEAYFDFANPRNWHFYLGQDQPEDRRIRAYAFDLLHGDAYLMIDSGGIATGAGISWGYDWKFGPVKVVLRAWIGASAAISWQPPQLEGSLNLGGEFEISVAGVGLGLSAEALLAGKAPTLYWIRGELRVSVKLPWPLKDLEEDVVLEWREEATPPSEDPFKSISIEHPKVDETWPGLATTLQGATPAMAGYAAGPIVPLDARPSIAFDRSMKDATTDRAFTSVDAYPGGTAVGEHVFDYELLDVTLEKWPKSGAVAWMPVEDVYGAWMAVEDGEGEPAFTRLQLWAKSPFAFTRQTSRTYRDAYLAQHADWPCVPPPDVVTHCVDWDDVKVGKLLGPTFEHQGLHFSLVLSDTAVVVNAGDNIDCGTRHALRFEDSNLIALWIVFPEPVHTVELCISDDFLAARAYANGVLVANVPNPPPGSLAFQASGIDSIVLWPSDSGQLASICYQTEAMYTDYVETFEHNMSVYTGIQRWESADEILEPETWYRLTVNQQTVRTHNGSANPVPFTHYAYFHTAGAPGLTPPWALDPATTPAENAEPPFPQGGRLIGLEPYVDWAIPADGAQPVYRAYDLGVEFNEDYVEQMVGADMAIRLTDANAQPVLDADGAEIVFPNQWAEQPTAELSETEYPYTTRVEDCLSLEIAHSIDQKITFANGVWLDEDFSGDLDQWTDPHPEDGGSWTIVESRLLYNNAVVPPLGALLVAGDSDWADYALEVTLSDQGEDVGLAWRYTNVGPESYYRLRLNALGRFLERIVDGAVEVLWEDGSAYAPEAGLTLAVSCQGPRLRGQLGGELLFDLTDEAALLAGQVGIFTNATAAFERFLVRSWPGASLAPQTQYRAELQASTVIHAGGLTTDGWIDPAHAWLALTRVNAQIAVLGREVWTDYRLEVNAEAIGRQIGLIARFQQNESAGTFACYRLMLNLNELSVHLARLSGTITGSTYELDEGSPESIWSCVGANCDVDFALDTHALALTCVGDDLIVEIDGVELTRQSEPGGPSAGKAGLYHLGVDEPVFSDLVVRTAPRGTVHTWTFVTSRYAGLVDHLDSFANQVYREHVTSVDIAQVSAALSAADAALSTATGDVADARALLAVAGPSDVAVRREAAQATTLSLSATSATHFDALYGLLLAGAYRPLPPVVEVTEVVQDRRRLALLIESPEPLDWTRISWSLSEYDPALGTDRPMPRAVLAWSDDGARAVVALRSGSPIDAGTYTLQLTYALDIGLEAPALRRGGSTIPEIARLRFTLD